jgi:hypothetical protein
MKAHKNPKPRSHVRIYLRSGGFVSVNLNVARPKIETLLTKTIDANGWAFLPKIWRDYQIPKDNISYIEVLDITGFSEDENDD